MGLVSTTVGVLCDWDIEAVSGLSLRGNHDEKYEVHEKGENKRPNMHSSLQVSLQRAPARRVLATVNRIKG